MGMPNPVVVPDVKSQISIDVWWIVIGLASDTVVTGQYLDFVPAREYPLDHVPAKLFVAADLERRVVVGDKEYLHWHAMLD